MKTHNQVADPAPPLDRTENRGTQAVRRARSGSLQDIADLAARITGASSAAVALEKASGDIVCAARTGAAAPAIGAVLKRSSGISAACVRTGEVQHCTDTQNDNRVDADLCRRLGIRSLMVVPLRRNGRVTGLLSVYSPYVSQFDHHHVARLEHLQSVAAMLAEAEDANAQLAPQLIAGVERGELLIETAQPPAPSNSAESADHVREHATNKADLESQPEKDVAPASELGSDALSTWLKPQQSVRPLRAVLFALAIFPIAALALTALWYRTMHTGGTRAQPRPAVATRERPESLPSAASLPVVASERVTEQAEGPETAPVAEYGVGYVRSIEPSSGPRYDRVTIALDHDVQYTAFRLDRPERVCFDLRNTRFAPEARPHPIAVAGLVLRSIRSSQYEQDVVRVVLDLKTRAAYRVEFEANPPRLIIEVNSGRREPVRAIQGPPATPAADAGALLGALVIALDPGHGGDDTGAVGRQGLQEKQLVLDVALRLGRLLERELGAKVIYTRRDDRLVPLEQRAALANEARAHLLISIHGNGSNDPSAEGVETYYLDAAASRESARLAQRENQGRDSSSVARMSANTLLQSQAFARRVQESLYAALRSGHVRNRGVRAAPLVVLRAARMPAILVEISFLSSPQEEQRLDSQDYRQQIAEALYSGIRRQVTSARGKRPGDTNHARAAAVAQSSRGL